MSIDLNSPAIQALIKAGVDAALNAALAPGGRVEEVVRAQVDGGQGSHASPESESEDEGPVKQETFLQAGVRFVVHILVHKALKVPTKNFFVGGEKSINFWPDTEDPMKFELELEPGDENGVGRVAIWVWRPDWRNPASCGEFFKAVQIRYAQEFKTDGVWTDPQYAKSDREISAALTTFMRGIAKAKKLTPAEAEAKKVNDRVNGRINTLTAAMRDFLPHSVLSECEDRKFYQAMFEHPLFHPRLYAWDEGHGLESNQYDEFVLRQDLWAGRMRPKSDGWLFEDPNWWSAKARTGFHILLEEVETESNKKRTTMFHLPPGRRQTPTLETLPPRIPALRRKKAKLTKVSLLGPFKITKGMVSAEVQANPDLASWAEDLPADPTPSTADRNFPTLASLLVGDRLYLAEAAKRHSDGGKVVSKDALVKLSKLRASASVDDRRYGAALMATDVEEYLRDVRV